jgi:transcriptional regulator with XRE-family HTH domain
LSAQVLLWRLPSGAVTEDESTVQRRRGYWLRRARIHKGESLKWAAVKAGLKPGSGSTVSLWESGQRPIKVIQLERLARAYGVPVVFLMRPEKTDEERLSEAIQSASDAERADWESEEESGPTVGDEPGDEPDIPPASTRPQLLR